MRTTFLDTAEAALRLLGEERLAAAWHEASVLEGLTVGGLAAHLARAVVTVQTYLTDDPPPARAETVDAAGYLTTALPDTDPASDVNRQVLARAEAGGADGVDAVRRTATAAFDELRRALAEAPADRRCSVLGGIAIGLDDYLATRVLELVVHSDDLVASVAGLAPPDLPEEGEHVAVGLLAEVARRRHGTTAMVRALARRERAPAEPPRAF